MAGRRSERARSRTVHIPAKPVIRPNLERVLASNPDEPHYIVRPLCGEQHIYEFQSTAEPPKHFSYSDFQHFTLNPLDHRVCSGCQSKALQKLYGGVCGDYKLGERLDLGSGAHTTDYSVIPARTPRWGITKYDWKSVYPVYDTKQDIALASSIVAFICIEAGFGKAWQIRGWEKGSNDAPALSQKVAQMVEISEAWTSTSGKVYPRQESLRDAKGIASKEAALLLIPDLVARGLLKTFVQVEEEIAEEAREKAALDQQRQEWREESARKSAEKAEKDRQDLAEITAALSEIIALKLSNSQRAGLLKAAERLGVVVE